jgi:alkanesulfonate monooxygenase SsuD/methylene tetrahydromethanopterin reductase-like flavin-dependent oxidoreductase (luciferase family)
MKIGIGLPNQAWEVRPTIIPRWAEQAEQAGFAALGTVGRVAYPGVMDTVALAAAAATTTTIGLLSSIMIAPVWPPVLLAKETAGIDAISGGRLTLGLSIGNRPDDFVVDGLDMVDHGPRFDRDLAIYRDVWNGEPVGGGPNPAVTAEARQIPLIIGGSVPASFERAARWGAGYISGSVPASMVAPAFEGVRAAWAEADRKDSPRLVAIAYFAVAEPELGRDNIYRFYSITGNARASLVTKAVAGGPQQIKDAINAFADIGADELMLNPAVPDPNEISRLADIVL